jgi:hypothetical protein
LNSQILSFFAISETVKTVVEVRLGRDLPKLKLGENEKLSFDIVSKAGVRMRKCLSGALASFDFSAKPHSLAVKIKL